MLQFRTHRESASGLALKVLKSMCLLDQSGDDRTSHQRELRRLVGRFRHETPIPIVKSAQSALKSLT